MVTPPNYGDVYLNDWQQRKIIGIDTYRHHRYGEEYKITYRVFFRHSDLGVFVDSGHIGVCAFRTLKGWGKLINE